MTGQPFSDFISSGGVAVARDHAVRGHGGLPAYAGAVFDHLVGRPELMRLMLWKQLERPGSTETEATSYQGKIAAVRQAQETGRFDAGMDRRIASPASSCRSPVAGRLCGGGALLLWVRREAETGIG